MKLLYINNQWFASRDFSLKTFYKMKVGFFFLHRILSSAIYFLGILAFNVPSGKSGFSVMSMLENSMNQSRKAMSSYILVKNTQRAERIIANWKFSVIPTFKVQTITM